MKSPTKLWRVIVLAGTLMWSQAGFGFFDFRSAFFLEPLFPEGQAVDPTPFLGVWDWVLPEGVRRIPDVPTRTEDALKIEERIPGSSRVELSERHPRSRHVHRYDGRFIKVNGRTLLEIRPFIEQENAQWKLATFTYFGVEPRADGTLIWIPLSQGLKNKLERGLLPINFKKGAGFLVLPADASEAELVRAELASLAGEFVTAAASTGGNLRRLETTDSPEIHGRRDRVEELGAVGLHLILQGGVVTVKAPIEDSQAARAGILPGDQIIKVDGEPTQGMGLDQFARKVGGRPGSVVALTIIREGMAQPLDISVTRGFILYSGLRWAVLREDIGYIRVGNPQGRAWVVELDKALRDLDQWGARALILDLRNSRGSDWEFGGIAMSGSSYHYLGATVNAATLFATRFLEPDKLILRTREHIEYRTRDEGVDRYRPDVDTPMVVLANKGTTGGAAILAAALKDHGRATLMGTVTGAIGGKGQGYLGPAGHQTTTRATTPNGLSFDGGITPDIVVEPKGRDAAKEHTPAGQSASRFEDDDQLQAALRELKAASVKSTRPRIVAPASRAAPVVPRYFSFFIEHVQH